MDISKTNIAQGVKFAGPQYVMLQPANAGIPDSIPDTVQINSLEQPTHIGFTRLLFSRLTDDQINQVNQTGLLPSNAKFVRNGQGGYTVTPNILNLTTGTRQIPAGFELKKDFLGFTVVLPAGSEGLFIKNMPVHSVTTSPVIPMAYFGQ